MRALTLWQPWAHVVARGEKLIENRPWQPPAWMFWQRFAIHAGKRWDKAGAELVEKIAGYMPSDVIGGAIIATTKLVGVVTSAEEAEEMSPGQGKWFLGPFGWVLQDTRETPVIPCRGYQKLWKLTDEQMLRLGVSP